MIQAGALTTLAIISGELQFSGAGAASVLAARIKGGDITLVACPADSDLVYLMARPEIKSAAELKGKSSAVTRLGSTTHFYLRSALKYAGLNPEKDVTILQLGTEYAAALETGRIAAAALPFDLALPYLQRGWPVLLDLSKTDFVYPASCVVSSRAFVKDNPDTVERFLKAYIEAIHLMKKDHGAGERAYNKWLKPKDPLLAKKAVEAYANLFKPIPRVTDRGIQAVLEDLALSTAVPKDLIERPDYFRDNGPLEKMSPAAGSNSSENSTEILFTAETHSSQNRKISKHEIFPPRIRNKFECSKRHKIPDNFNLDSAYLDFLRFRVYLAAVRFRNHTDFFRLRILDFVSLASWRDKIS